MYTIWTVSLTGTDETLAMQASSVAEAEINRLDLALAMWRPESEVSLLNLQRGGKMSDDVSACLNQALNAAQMTQGAFNPAVGQLVQLWYDHLQKKQIPSNQDIVKARKDSQMSQIAFKDSHLKLLDNVRIDLGGVAKGFAQDKVAQLLRQQGFENFLINAGGQVYAAGQKPDGSAWQVGIIHPRNKEQVIAVLPLKDQVLATSGDYEQVTEIGGKKYHHIIDPRSGKPSESGVLSSSVVLNHQNRDHAGALADALATAGLVLGASEAQAMTQKAEGAGLWVTELDGSLQMLKTKNLVLSQSAF